MTKHRLTPRQKLFCERRLLIHEYPTNTDAYLSVYNCKGSRRTATANASRILNKSAVQAYAEQLRDADARIYAEAAETAHQRRILDLKARGILR